MRSLLLSMLCFSWSAAGAIVVMDDNGQEVRLEQPTQRIVSLAPNITEVTVLYWGRRANCGRRRIQ